MRFRVFRQERPRGRLLDQQVLVHGADDEDARDHASRALGIPLHEVRVRKE